MLKSLFLNFLVFISAFTDSSYVSSQNKVQTMENDYGRLFKIQLKDQEFKNAFTSEVARVHDNIINQTSVCQAKLKSPFVLYNIAAKQCQKCEDVCSNIEGLEERERQNCFRDCSEFIGWLKVKEEMDKLNSTNIDLQNRIEVLETNHTITNQLFKDHIANISDQTKVLRENFPDFERHIQTRFTTMKETINELKTKYTKMERESQEKIKLMDIKFENTSKLYEKTNTDLKDENVELGNKIEAMQSDIDKLYGIAVFALILGIPGWVALIWMFVRRGGPKMCKLNCRPNNGDRQPMINYNQVNIAQNNNGVRDGPMVEPDRDQGHVGAQGARPLSQAN